MPKGAPELYESKRTPALDRALAAREASEALAQQQHEARERYRKGRFKKRMSPAESIRDEMKRLAGRK